MKRVGLLGGTFNPPHEGHLKLARLALDHLELDELRFMPTALSPHKPNVPGPDAPTRIRMLDEALKDLGPRVRIEPLEVARGGVSYTVDTLETLARTEPSAQWILIMGSDQLLGFRTWRQPERILQLASLAVGLRPGVPLAGTVGLEPVEAWSGIPGQLVLLPSTDLNLASSHLRRQLLANPDQAPNGIPERVLRTIRSKNLYR
jgi:nicotinate-nucleotide adenylyltransferase